MMLTPALSVAVFLGMTATLLAIAYIVATRRHH